MTRLTAESAAQLVERVRAGATIAAAAAEIGISDRTVQRAARDDPALAAAIANASRARRRAQYQPHGTTASYLRGCRCPQCREEHRARSVERRAARRRRAIPADVTHGAAAYANWGCRCDVCRAANSAKTAARRERLSQQRA
jgi:predicted transcriptional regulator